MRCDRWDRVTPPCEEPVAPTLVRARRTRPLVRTRTHRPILAGTVRRSAVVSVQVIKPVLSLCGREKELPEVSHISLTHRGEPNRRQAEAAAMHFLDTG